MLSLGGSVGGDAVRFGGVWFADAVHTASARSRAARRALTLDSSACSADCWFGVGAVRATAGDVWSIDLSFSSIPGDGAANVAAFCILPVGHSELLWPEVRHLKLMSFAMRCAFCSAVSGARRGVFLDAGLARRGAGVGFGVDGRVTGSCWFSEEPVVLGAGCTGKGVAVLSPKHGRLLW